MEGFCLKCSKDLADKRRGTEYCSTNCRVSKWQRKKRAATKQAEPIQIDEVQLDKLMARGRELMEYFEALSDIEKSTGQELQPLIICKADLVEWCKRLGNHPMLGPSKKK